MALKENTFHSETELGIDLLIHKCLKLFLVSLKLKFSDINPPFHYITDLYSNIFVTKIWSWSK